MFHEILALLASAAKDLNLRYSPYSMKRALETGASKVEGADPLSVGAGLVQVSIVNVAMKHKL